MYYCYLLRCTDGSLYAGSTNNLLKREQLHNAGKGSAYVRSRGGGTIVYFEGFSTRSEALRREAKIKRLPKLKKELLVYPQTL